MRHYIISCLILMLTSISSIAQVNFKLQPDGSFRTEDGADYVVVPCQGKNAHDLYIILTSNATSIFNDVSKAMNTVEDNTVKIRGFAESGKIFPYVTMFKHSAEGYYQLDFKVRDGRIRVSAPLVEDAVMITEGTNVPFPGRYSLMVATHLFDKNGKVKKKRVKDVAAVESYLNSIINRMLATTNQIEEDW